MNFMKDLRVKYQKEIDKVFKLIEEVDLNTNEYSLDPLIKITKEVTKLYKIEGVEREHRYIEDLYEQIQLDF